MSKFICYLCNTGEHPHSIGEKCSTIWYTENQCECDMSKSAFYASKESLRKTREKELEELIKLREFRDWLLNLSRDEITDLDIIFEVLEKARAAVV